MRDIVWRMQQPLALIIVAPKDYQPDPGAPTVVTAQDFNLYLLDPSQRAKLATAIPAAAGGSIVCDTWPGWAVGDWVEISQDDGTRLNVQVDTIDADTKTATYIETTTENAAVGARAIKVVGPAVVGSTYGTASLSTRDWGYVGYLPLDQTSWYQRMFVGDHLLVEGALETAGAADYTRAWNVTLVEPSAER